MIIVIPTTRNYFTVPLHLYWAMVRPTTTSLFSKKITIIPAITPIMRLPYRYIISDTKPLLFKFLYFVFIFLHLQEVNFDMWLAFPSSISFANQIFNIFCNNIFVLIINTMHYTVRFFGNPIPTKSNFIKLVIY